MFSHQKLKTAGHLWVITRTNIHNSVIMLNIYWDKLSQYYLNLKRLLEFQSEKKTHWRQQWIHCDIDTSSAVRLDFVNNASARWLSFWSLANRTLAPRRRIAIVPFQSFADPYRAQLAWWFSCWLRRSGTGPPLPGHDAPSPQCICAQTQIQHRPARTLRCFSICPVPNKSI